MAEKGSEKKTLHIKNASELTKEKVAEVNKVLSDIHAGKIKPMVFSLHIRI